MATKEKPLKFSRLGMTILVYGNRLEVREGILFRSNKVIPFKSIASVGVGQYTKRLEIATNDGKTMKYAIGGFGKAHRCRDAIVQRM